MICKKCGAQIEDNSTECKFCGAAYEITEPIEEETAESVPPAEEVPGINNDADTDMLFDENEIKRQRQMERIKAEKQSQLDEIEKRRKEKKIKQKRTRVIVVLIVLLCLGAAAVGGYYIFGNDSEKTEVTVVTETPEATEQPIETVAPEESPSPSPEQSDPSSSPMPEQSEAPVTESGQTNSGAGQAAQSGTTANGATAGGASNVQTQNASQSVAKPAPAPKPTAAPVKKPAANTAVTTPSTSAATMGGTEYKADGGMNGDKFVSALVTGVEVVESAGKKYMSFKYNGSTYYAKVSANTTTNFIAGKAMTVSAYKVSETYNGVNVYNITAITHYNGKYVFPNSGFKLLTEADLAGKSDWELKVGRNEIYARHGRQFKDSALQKYFNGCSWYKIKSSYNYSNDAINLNSIESANANFIKKFEETH